MNIKPDKLFLDSPIDADMTPESELTILLEGESTVDKLKDLESTVNTELNIVCKLKLEDRD